MYIIVSMYTTVHVLKAPVDTYNIVLLEVLLHSAFQHTIEVSKNKSDCINPYISWPVVYLILTLAQGRRVAHCQSAHQHSTSLVLCVCKTCG